MSRIDPLTLTREELYELVWSKPMLELAKDFGLSDVALAKRCRRLAVPVPGRGYWARIAAGQTPRQAPLKKRNEEPSYYSALTFHAPDEDAPRDQGKAATTAAKSEVRQKILALGITEVIDLRAASAIVKRTAMHLKVSWRKEITWERGERSGPIVRIDVSDACVERALRLAEQLLLAVKEVGWKARRPEPNREEQSRSRYSPAPSVPGGPEYVQILAEDEPFAFHIDERRRRIDHVPTEEEKQKRRRGEYIYAPRWDYLHTGELRLHVAGKTWQDTATKKLEFAIGSVLDFILTEALAIKVRREERRLAEIEARRQEQLRWKLSQRRQANERLIHELEAQAGAWFRARMLRSYLRALKRELNGRRLEANLQDRKVDFINWVEHYIEQLDPLSPRPHDEDLMDDRPTFGPKQANVDETLSRLVGSEWATAWKISDSDAQEDAIESNDLGCDAGEIRACWSRSSALVSRCARSRSIRQTGSRIHLCEREESARGRRFVRCERRAPDRDLRGLKSFSTEPSGHSILAPLINFGPSKSIPSGDTAPLAARA